MILLVAAALAATQPVVSVSGGRIAGEALPNGSTTFRGIPFAQPPVGALRWKPPQPVTAWKGVRDATKSSPGCRQPDQGWNKQWADPQSEDCLYLDVRTPNLTPAKPYPVMVWIHGGANVAGGGAGTIASSLVERGVVLVSIQYRLGVFGFLSHPALSAESKNKSSGNYALLDHQAALKWVQENIGRFGGDPDNVTIFGESAGAQDVGLLMVAPGGRGLFHKAISESGTVSFGTVARSLAANEMIGETIAARAGAPRANAARLRALPADDLLKAGEGPIPGVVGAPWTTAVVDGIVLREAPADTLAQGRQARVPLIIGANAKEFSLGPIAANVINFIRTTFGTDAERALAYYGLNQGGKPVNDERLGDAAMQVSSDALFRCPAVAVSKMHAKAGAPVWQYHFDYAPAAGPPVAHASELRYVFNAPGEQDIPADAAPLQAYWINFAKTGDPNGPGLPAWPRYDLEARPYLAFLTSGPKVGTGLRDEICQGRDLP